MVRGAGGGGGPGGSRPDRATLARVLRVGLTGGIAAGKSTVSRRLASHGAVVVDADQLAREVVAPGSDGLAEVVDAFGPGVLGADGTLDRAALGAVVFADKAARTRLEAITHPRIRTVTEQQYAAAPDDAIVVHDIPLLVELGYEDRYHLTVVVHADAEDRVRRLVAERGSTEGDARRRVAAQAGDDARRRAADVWLDNTGATEDLLAEVDRLWNHRLLPYEAGIRSATPAPRAAGLHLVGPDPSWGATGARLAARVARAAGDAVVRVDHTGPTAVPGLPAEDVVDLQLVVAHLAVADAVTDRLAAAGFPRLTDGWTDTPVPDHPPEALVVPPRNAGPPAPSGPGASAPRWEERLHGSADPGQAVLLHVRVAGSPGARYALLLRDWLRAEPSERDGYAGAGRQPVEEHRARADHAEAEEPWSTDVAWPRMQAWARRTGWVSPV